MDDYLHQMRRNELDVAMRLVPFAGKRVLEIGAGDGYLSSQISAVASVEAIDVYQHPRALHPVRLYDGRTLPFAGGAFDIVFSANVLEHIEDLDGMLAEMRRVLSPGGVAVHVVPSAAWRIFTSVMHYPAIPLLMLNRNRVAGSGARTERRGIGWFLSRVLAAGRHGEKGNALTEIWRFSRWGWRRTLAGWDVSWHPTGPLYSGYGVLGPRLSLATRSSLGISSTVVLIATPRR
jgi:SAM-dependent methyltransferase